MTRALDRDKLLAAFDEIGRAAVAAGTRLQIAVYGGSALMLASNFRFARKTLTHPGWSSLGPNGCEALSKNSQPKMDGPRTGLTMVSYFTSAHLPILSAIISSSVRFRVAQRSRALWCICPLRRIFSHSSSRQCA